MKQKTLLEKCEHEELICSKCRTTFYMSIFREVIKEDCIKKADLKKAISEVFNKEIQRCEKRINEIKETMHITPLQEMELIQPIESKISILKDLKQELEEIIGLGEK